MLGKYVLIYLLTADLLAKMCCLRNFFESWPCYLLLFLQQPE